MIRLRTAVGVAFALALAAGGGPVPGSVPAAGAQDAAAPSGEAGTAAPAEATGPDTEATVPETSLDTTPGAAAAEDDAGEAPAADAAAVPETESTPETEAPLSEAAPVPGTEAPAEPPTPPKPAVDWSKVTNPVPADAASIARGQEYYNGRGFCNVCHGAKGDGFGPVAIEFDPMPNAFFEAEWQKDFSDGQLMGVLQEGKVGTGMVPIVPEYLTEAEGWDVVNYVRSLRGKTTEAYERSKALKAMTPEEREKALQKENP